MWRLGKSSTKTDSAPRFPDPIQLEREIASARVALQNINELLERISPRDNRKRRRSGGTYLILIAVSGIFCIASILFTINAFTDAQPTGNGGIVEILVSGEGKDTIGLLTTYDAGKTEYALYFPQLQAPVKWALVLIGPAILSKVDRYPQAVNQFSQYRTGTCSSGTGDNPGSQVEVRCQVFYGSFTPSELSGTDVQRDFSNCSPSSSLFPPTVGYGGSIADAIVSGTSGAAASQPIFTKVITLPLLTQPPAQVEDGIYPVGSIQDLAVGDITAGVGCDIITAPSGYEITDEIPSPDFQAYSGLYWKNSFTSGSPSVVVKRTWAGAAANVGVIAAGVFFTLITIFLPQWLQTRQGPPPIRRR
jgi:hypothetical protein